MTETTTRTSTHTPRLPHIQRTADPNRQKRRALVKALGKRQFKKLYRGAKDE